MKNKAEPISGTNQMSKKAFTLIELLVVIAIIGLLATIVLVSVGNLRTDARDAKRLADIRQVEKALDLYFLNNNNYPDTDGDGCWGWDVGNQEYPFMKDKLPGIMNNPPEDPSATGNCSGYFFYRYSAGSAGCDPNKGAFYVLGVGDIEKSGRPHPNSPGWQCPGYNWQDGFDWVTGKFEN